MQTWCGDAAPTKSAGRFPPQRVQVSDGDRFSDFTRRVNQKNSEKRETSASLGEN
jgi:hypothetical protein